MRSARIPSAALLLALCAGARAEPPPSDAGPAGGPSLLAVYPQRLGWDDDALAAALTADALAAARRGRLEVLAPEAFRVSDAASRNVLAGSDLARVLAARGLPPRAFLVLRGTAERRVARTVSQLTEGGATRSALEEETVWLARVEVLGPDSDAPLAEARGQAERRGEAPPGADPAPELRRLHARLLAAALEALERRLGPAPAR